MEKGRLSSEEFDAFVDQILSVCADRANADLHEILVRRKLIELLRRHESYVDARWRVRTHRLEERLAEAHNRLELESQATAQLTQRLYDSENQVVLSLRNRFESEAQAGALQRFDFVNQVWRLPRDASPNTEREDFHPSHSGRTAGDSSSISPLQKPFHEPPPRLVGKENIGMVAQNSKSGAVVSVNESILSECPRREVRRALTGQLLQRAPLQQQVPARSLSPNRDVVPSPQCSASMRRASPDTVAQNPRSSPRSCSVNPSMNPRSSPVRKSGGLNTGSFAPPRRPQVGSQVPQGAGGSFAPPGMVSSAPHLLRPGGPPQYPHLGMVRALSQVIRLPSHTVN